MSDWGHASEGLFRTARRGLAPSAEDRARVRARIATKLAAAAASAAVATTASKAAASGAGAGTGASAGAGVGAGAAVAKASSVTLVAKIVAPIVIAGGAATLGAPHFARVMQHEASAPATRTAPTSGTSATTTATARLASSSPGATTDSPREAQGPIAAVSVTSLPTLPSTPLARGARGARGEGGSAQARAAASAVPTAEEIALVGEIDGALRSGDVAAVSRLSAEHERRFPRGILVEEREAARVIARCTTSSRSPAMAARFLDTYPRSPMRDRVIAACTAKNDGT